MFERTDAHRRADARYNKKRKHKVRVSVLLDDAQYADFQTLLLDDESNPACLRRLIAFALRMKKRF